MTELFGGNYFSTAWPHPSTEIVFGGAQSLMGHKQSPIRSVIKVNWSLDFLKVLRFSFPVPVVWPSSLTRFCCRKHIYLFVSNIQQYRLFNFIYVFVTTFRFFIKSLEEERLNRSKLREYSSRFVLSCFDITVT